MKKIKELVGTSPLSSDELFQMRATSQQQVGGDRVSVVIYFRDGLRIAPLCEQQPLVIGRCAPADIPLRDNSLSRQHACLELTDGEVWVEDLGSTNGTWLDGQRVTRGKVLPGQVLHFGAATASLQNLAPTAALTHGLEGHDRFSTELHAEICRAKTFGNTTALLILRSDRRKEHHVSRWLPPLREKLRQFDRIGLYSVDTVEVLLVETSAQQALELATAATQGSVPLCCGLGLFPQHAQSAEELLDVTLHAARRATQQMRVVEAVSSAVTMEGGDDAADPEGPVVHSPAMKALFEQARKLGSAAIPVIIKGETGTGKEVIARAIHYGGKRVSRPMVSVNCGAIPSQLLESTLFGYERGAFTGAQQRAKGVFESADGGSVFLDEIGELPLPAQVALLRVLETKRFTRVGSSQETEVDVRVIAATHRDLAAMCEAGQFRQDLYFRLDAMTIDIPPLRQRPEEIEPLAKRFLALANQANGCRVTDLDPATIDLLVRYSWPGNVRELRNAIERAVVLAEQGSISIDDLPEKIRAIDEGVNSTDMPLATARPRANEAIANLKSEMQRYECGLILTALEQNDWNRSAAAHSLGIPLRTLAHKIQLHGIKRLSGGSADPQQ